MARAIRSGNSEIIKLLLAAGANPTDRIISSGKNIAVGELYTQADKEVADLLKCKAQEFMARGVAFMKAYENNKPDGARALCAMGIDINAKDQDSREILIHKAVSKGDRNIVELLIKTKADVNAQDIFGSTPLHKAAYNGYKDILELLISAKADVNAKDNLHWIPLRWATHYGHDEVVEVLKNAAT